MSKLTPEQRYALTLLSDAMTLATNSGLFDVLMTDCKSPDSINDVCDAVTTLDREMN